jgi:glycosyltransferase involved in cell wall biosynthesis
MSQVVVDARLPWGSGIGRYVSNCVPRVCRLMPNVSFEVVTTLDAQERANAVFGAVSNAHVTTTAVSPFSLEEQLRPPFRRPGNPLVWFTNYWVPLAYRGPSMVAVHDMIHLEPELFPVGKVKRQLSRLTFQHIARHAGALCYGSRFTQREFERRFGPPARSAVTGYGIDHDGWMPFDPAHPPMKKKQLLVVAAAKKHKNFEIVVRAFGQAAIFTDWSLKIITPNDQLRSSIDLGAMVAGGARVSFAQGLTNDELRAVYADTAILLMPSRYEGFGLPLAEGLQAGAQCISSAAESLVELGQGARVTFVNSLDLTGWIKAIETECERFDADAVPASEVARNMAHAMKFRWDDVAVGTSHVMADLLAYAVRT